MPISLWSYLWRNLQRLKLQGWYREDANNALFDYQVFSSSCVCRDILMIKQMNFCQIFFLQRGRRRRPLFAVSLWNVHGRVELDLPRTNNSIEAWHNSFDLRVRITHPTIRRLSAKLVEEQASNELLLERVLALIPQPPPEKKYQVINERLKNIISEIDTYENMITYCRAIAHNL